MNKKIAVLIPCYKRPEYTKLCLDSVVAAQLYPESVDFYLVDDGSRDGTVNILNEAKLNSYVTVRDSNRGLRHTIMDFFEQVQERGYDYIAKIDSDCTVPANWLNDLVDILEEAGADVISPNVSETNAAHKYGAIQKRKGRFIPSQIVGGLWFMRTDMIKDIYFERVPTSGIRAAFHIINQIVVEKEPVIGWTDAVTYGDIGHWSGTHPDHIKSIGHAIYSTEVGRPIAWQPEQKDQQDREINFGANI